MTGKYWSETPERHEYFEDQFFSLLRDLSKTQNVTVRELLSSIKGFNAFKNLLEASYSMDASLIGFFGSMTNANKKEFFNRVRIQEINNANIQAEKISQEVIEEIPIDVKQVKKVSREFFNATIKGKRTRAYKDEFKIKGKKRTAFRAPNGRFAKRT